MRPTELRIGNYFYLMEKVDEIKVPVHFIQQVVTLGLLKVEFVNAGDNPAMQEKLFETTYFDMSPIPSTEQWLLDFGFVRKSDHHALGKFKVDFSSMGVVRYHSKIGIVYLDYVHQLQNLYNPLTQKELTL